MRDVWSEDNSAPIQFIDPQLLHQLQPIHETLSDDHDRVHKLLSRNIQAGWYGLHEWPSLQYGILASSPECNSSTKGMNIVMTVGKQYGLPTSWQNDEWEDMDCRDQVLFSPLTSVTTPRLQPPPAQSQEMGSMQLLHPQAAYPTPASSHQATYSMPLQAFEHRRSPQASGVPNKCCQLPLQHSQRLLGSSPGRGGPTNAASISRVSADSRQAFQRRQRLLASATAPPPLPAPTEQAHQDTGKGRRSGPLAEDARAKTLEARKKGACWRCSLQRDRCEPGDGSECKRCSKQPEDVIGTLSLRCDRTKLPLLLGDILPFSMTRIHQKQEILKVMEEDTVGGISSTAEEFIIYLTSGFGPDLGWPMVEFKPKDDSVTTQFQFYRNPHTRTMEKRDKYSPPFAIKSLSSEEQCFEQYLNDILSSPQHLNDFAGLCYLDESRHHKFQEGLLQTFCELYLGTDDHDLGALMKRILRMLILTNIMTHTLTIVEGTLRDTLNHLRQTPAPTDHFKQKQTSPKLANRQLKFFFATKRYEIWCELLHTAQRLLRASVAKEKTWMLMFVLLLGFAMALEQNQGIMQIQAVSKSAKGEMSWDASQKEAVDACRRIDETFDFLVTLFQHKYRSHTWTSCGSFGNQTPMLSDQATQLFLDRLRRSLEQNRDHLEERSKVPICHEQQYNYISRLVARFLLAFLDLPE